jgi:hypothetical protein
VTARVSFKQDDVKRAVKGAIDAGVQVGRVEVQPDGKIVIIPVSVAANDSESDGSWQGF